jgi:S1-C subfamily serine protease
VSVSGARVASGTLAVFAGFPGGGPLTSGPAEVVGGVVLPSVGPSGVTLRPALRLTADVRPGNSGGPLFDARGAVIGMIDARSLTSPHVGFAITTEPVLAALDVNT